MKKAKISWPVLTIAVIAVMVVGIAMYALQPKENPAVTVPDNTNQTETPATNTENNASTQETPASNATGSQSPVLTGTVTQAQFFLTVDVDKASYTPTQNIKIFGKTFPESSITLQVINQFKAMQRTRLLTADANGNYEDNFKFGTTISKGTYTVNVTAHTAGYIDLSNVTTFEFVK